MNANFLVQYTPIAPLQLQLITCIFESWYKNFNSDLYINKNYNKFLALPGVWFWRQPGIFLYSLLNLYLQPTSPLPLPPWRKKKKKKTTFWICMRWSILISENWHAVTKTNLWRLFDVGDARKLLFNIFIFASQLYFYVLGLSSLLVYWAISILIWEARLFL